MKKILFLLFLSSCSSDFSYDESECSMDTHKAGAMNDGWAKTGVLITGKTQSNYSMQAAFERALKGSGAQYYTIEFGVQPPGNGVFAARAEIIWSTEGNDVRRLISIGNGAVISGTAQAAKVTVFDVTPNNPTHPADLGFNYRIDTLITPGCRPSQQMPPRLFELPTFSGGGINSFQVPAGGSLAIPVPKNAGVISVNVNAFLTASPNAAIPPGVAAASLDGPTGYGLLMNIKPTDEPSNSSAWVPVPPNAINLFLNATGDNVTFAVTWGIEG